MKKLPEQDGNASYDCTICERERTCYMYEKYQRLPRPEGLGLCPKIEGKKVKK